MKTTTRTLTTIATAAALILALAAPSASAAPSANGYKTAKFKVTIKGVQKMVQQHTHFTEDTCDPDNYSSGSETVVFTSRKPVIVTALKSPFSDTPTLTEGKTANIPVKTTVKRSYTPRITASTGDCEDNGGGVTTEPEAPDCGTRVLNDAFDLEYLDKPRGRVGLMSEIVTVDPYERCSGAGDNMSYPYLLTETTSGKPISAALSAPDLFDPQFRQWISVGSGSKRYQGSDYWVKTSVRWEVNFTRLGKR